MPEANSEQVNEPRMRPELTECRVDKESNFLQAMKTAHPQQRHRRIVRTAQQRHKNHFRIQVARTIVLAKSTVASPTDTEVISPPIRDTTLHSTGLSSPHPLVGDVVRSRQHMLQGKQTSLFLQTRVEPDANLSRLRTGPSLAVEGSHLFWCCCG